ncbi:hypothetical protein ACWGCP_37090, partial [Streptomyces niveus]
MSVSPLIGADDLVAYGTDDLTTEPGAPHTVAELDALICLLTAPRSRIHSVAVGHSRDEATARGGAILAVVDWPESAASWLRPARRLTAGLPDAWVVAATPLGFAQLARRLRHSTAWDPARTVAFASLLDSRVPALAGPDTVRGLRG